VCFWESGDGGGGVGGGVILLLARPFQSKLRKRHLRQCNSNSGYSKVEKTLYFRAMTLPDASSSGAGGSGAGGGSGYGSGAGGSGAGGSDQVS
jgi:hypothetical protein